MWERETLSSHQVHFQKVYPTHTHTQRGNLQMEPTKLWRLTLEQRYLVQPWLLTVSIGRSLPCDLIQNNTRSWKWAWNWDSNHDIHSQDQLTLGLAIVLSASKNRWVGVDKLKSWTHQLLEGWPLWAAMSSPVKWQQKYHAAGLWQEFSEVWYTKAQLQFWK